MTRTEELQQLRAAKRTEDAKEVLAYAKEIIDRIIARTRARKAALRWDKRNEKHER